MIARGIEYNLVAFNEFYNSKGTIHKTTAYYFSEMNEKAERKNRTPLSILLTNRL